MFKKTVQFFRNSDVLFLLAIFIVGLAVRLYRIGVDTPSLYADELGHAHYLLAVQNFDLFNPLTWIGAIYGLIFTFTWFLGRNAMGIRVPAAVYGSLIPLVMWWMVRGFNNSNLRDGNSRLEKSRIRLIAVFTALLGAITPWSFMISRIGHTHIPLVVILVCLSLGFYFRKKYWWSLVFLVLGTYVYSSLIVISPLVLGVMCIDMWKQKKLKLLWGVGGIVTLVLLIFLFRYRGFSAHSRGLDLAIWRDVNVTAGVNLYRGIARGSSPSFFSWGLDPEIAGRLFYNFPVAVVSQFGERYLSFLSVDWLFLKGDPVLRHSTGMVGELYLWMLPFMAWGAVRISGVLKDKWARGMFWVWLFVSPIPAAITKDGGGYLLRVITLLPFLSILTAIGVVDLCGMILAFTRKYEVRGSMVKFYYFLGVGIFATYSFYAFLFGYFYVYPTLSAKSYEYGFKQLALWQKNHFDDGHMLVVWQGYYPAAYFKWWQNYPLESFTNPYEKRIGNKTNAYYKINEGLYFGWPSSSDDFYAFVEKNNVRWVVFAGDYLKANPGYIKGNVKIAYQVDYPDATKAFLVYDVGK